MYLYGLNFFFLFSRKLRSYLYVKQQKKSKLNLKNKQLFSAECPGYYFNKKGVSNLEFNIKNKVTCTAYTCHTCRIEIA